MNEHCVLLKFYDEHDVWHMLSACGMFFALLVGLIIIVIQIIEVTFIHFYAVCPCH